MYKKILDEKSNIRSDHIFRSSDQAWIPTDPANMDYQEYLKWRLLEGNPITIEDLPEKDS